MTRSSLIGVAAAVALLGACAEEPDGPLDDESASTETDAEAPPPEEELGDAPDEDAAAEQVATTLGSPVEVGDLELTVIDLQDPAEAPEDRQVDGRWVAAQLELANTSGGEATPPELTFVDDADELHTGLDLDTPDCEGLGPLSDGVADGTVATGCQGIELPEDRSIVEIRAVLGGETVRWTVG